MNDNILDTNQEKYSQEEKLKAAYALNMCTVSVSQIVDYKDSYILEQEYDAILNNLNLKEVPKDEALLRILSELLNVITFFRIQDIKKAQIEKRYQQRLKNAIWSAIPNFSVIVSGSPIAIAYSLATQIGTGYMNYRREKIKAGTAKEEAEFELQITAIEQFNALKRELFTTAWRLADEYDFDDEWRLTEKQIEQYNRILQDTNEYRKYARLEAIADRFVAYPPFWYFYGHTANYIAETARRRMTQNTQKTEEYYRDSAVLKEYSELAKKHYEHYYTLTKNNILREDQLAASCALEYVDLLWNEEKKDIHKIYELLKLAEKMAPNSFDIMQLCAISYLKIGKSDDAVRLFKILVNEQYNTTANAKLLSRIYVSKYLTDRDMKAYSDYQLLQMQSDSLYLYPMPVPLTKGNQENILEEKFLRTQKAILKKAYRLSLVEFAKKQAAEFNSILPAPVEVPENRKSDYYSNTSVARVHRKADVKRALSNKGKAEYIGCLKECRFRIGYIDVLNKTIAGIEELPCFRNLETHDKLIYVIEARLRGARNDLSEIQAKMDDGSLDYKDYEELVDHYSYQYFTEDFFGKLKEKISELIDAAPDFEFIGKLEQELVDFCDHHDLSSLDQYLYMTKVVENTPVDYSHSIPFDDELLGEKRNSQDNEKMRIEMKKVLKDYVSELVLKQENVCIYLLGDMEFRSYLGNDKLRVQEGSIYLIRQKAFAVLDDRSKRDFDLIFCTDGIAVVDKNRIRDIVCYGDIKYSESRNVGELKLGYPDVFSNKDVNIKKLYDIISELDKYVRNMERQ